MPEPVSVMIARFPGGNSEHPDTTDWLIPTVITMKADPRIKDVLNWRIADTPITMGRNHAIVLAQEKKVDFLVMIDSAGPRADEFQEHFGIALTCVGHVEEGTGVGVVGTTDGQDHLTGGFDHFSAREGSC